jgi:hypothetical protein
VLILALKQTPTEALAGGWRDRPTSPIRSELDLAAVYEQLGAIDEARLI